MNLETIRRITVQATNQGVDQTTQSLNKLAAAQSNVAVVSDESAKRALSAQAAYDRQTRSVDVGARMQYEFEKAAKVANAQLAQGNITKDEHNKRMGVLAQKYEQGSAASKAFAGALSGVSGQLIALSAGAGPAGVFLAALGPWGLAAAIGLGGVAKALAEISAGAHELAQKSIELQKFADTTGLSTAAVQALRSEASKFNLTGDEVENVIRTFTARFNELRLGQGELLTQVRRVNPALADQMAAATDASAALTLFGRALQGVDNIFQRNALVRAAGGRGGLASASFLTGIDVDAITQGYVEAGKALDQNLINKLGKLEIESAKASSHAKQNISSIFAEASLQWERDWNVAFDKFTSAATKWAKDQGFFGKIGAWVLSQGAGLLGSVAPSLAGPAVNAITPPGSKTATNSSMAGLTLGGIGSAVGLGDMQTAEFLLNKQKELLAVLGPAATLTEQYKLKLAELAIKMKDAGIAENDVIAIRAKAALAADLVTQKEALRIGQLGELTSVDELVKQKEDALQKTIREGATFSTQEIENIRTRNRLLAENSKIENQMVFDRQQLFRSQGDQTIEATLRAAGIPPESERAKAIRDYMRMTDVLRELNTLGGEFAAGFAKDIANGVAPMDALVNAAKRLGEALIDILAKKAVTQTLGSVFGGLTETAGMSAGATSAATILTGAGATVAASIVAGATEAAAILGLTIPTAAATLPVAGAVTGTEVAVGGAAAGTALAVGGTVAGTAIWGPIALLLAAVAAVAALVGFGGNSAQKQAERNQILGYNNRAILANTNTTTLAGQLKQFDLNAQVERNALPNGGLTQKSWTNTLTFGLFGDKGGQPTAALRALEEAQAAERLKIIRDFGIQAAEAEKQAEAQRLKVIDDFNRSLNTARGNSFLNDFQDLIDNIAHFQAAGVDPTKLIEFTQLAAQKLVNDAGLVGDQFTLLTDIFPQLTGVVHESTKAIQDQVAAQKQLDTAARNIVDYLNGLKAGPNSTLSPGAKESAAQTTYSATYALAHAGNIDALNRITQDAENLRVAARELWGSSTPYQNLVNAITNELLALPAVQGTTDPVVAAVRDAITAIQLTTTAVGDGNFIANQQQAALLTIQNATAAQASLQATQNQLIGTANSLTTTTNALLDAIRSLNDTSLQTLTLLNSQFAAHPISFSVTSVNRTGSSTETFNISNNMIDALNKIVYNTYAIAQNTFTLAEGTNIGTAGRPRLSGQFATGGVIPAYGLGLVSEHLNPTFLRAGAEPITVSPYAPANDNSALVAEVRALRAEVAALRRENNAMIKNAADVAHADAVEMIDAHGDDTKKISEAVRMGKRDQRAA